jgi:excisionase family DNA binding protein
MKNNGQHKLMFTTRDLAKFLNVHINTVRRWSDQGIIKSYRIGPRGDRRFAREDVQAFLAATQQQPVIRVGPTGTGG